MRRFAGVSEAGARSRNPEQSEGTHSPKPDFRSGNWQAADSVAAQQVFPTHSIRSFSGV